MPEVNSIQFPSTQLGRYPGHAPGTAAKPKLLDRLGEALRSRHFFATNLIEAEYDIRTIMIYTHVLNRGGQGVRSPADSL